MRACGTGSVLVVGSKGGGHGGLFTESDLLKSLAGGKKDAPWRAPVAAHMTPAAQLLRLEPGRPAFEALARMSQSGASHVVVGALEGHEIEGVLSMRALLRYVVDHA